jgi:hypothetical protein
MCWWNVGQRFSLWQLLIEWHNHIPGAYSHRLAGSQLGISGRLAMAFICIISIRRVDDDIHPWCIQYSDIYVVRPGTTAAIRFSINFICVGIVASY